MKNNTVIMIIVAALLSVFLLGMFPVMGQSEADTTQEEPIYITSETIGGYSDPHKVTFISDGRIIKESVLNDGTQFGNNLPELKAKEGYTCYGWLMPDKTYLTGETPVTQSMRVIADYETYKAFSKTAEANGMSVTVGVPSTVAMKYVCSSSSPSFRTFCISA